MAHEEPMEQKEREATSDQLDQREQQEIKVKNYPKT